MIFTVTPKAGARGRERKREKEMDREGESEHERDAAGRQAALQLPNESALSL